MAAVGVRVQRVATSATGQRVFTPTAGPVVPSTDDRGEYRMFGLAAGDYIVMAQPRLPGSHPGQQRSSPDDRCRSAMGGAAAARRGGRARCCGRASSALADDGIRQRVLPEHRQRSGCRHRVGRGRTGAPRHRSAHAVHSDCTSGGHGDVGGWRTRTGSSGDPDSRSRSRQPRGRALHGDDGSRVGRRQPESHECRRHVLAAGCGTGWVHGACADRAGHRARRRTR